MSGLFWKYFQKLNNKIFTMKKTSTCYCGGIIIPRFFDHIKYFRTYSLNPVWQPSGIAWTHDSNLLFCLLTSEKNVETYVDKWMCFSVYWPLPYSGSSHSRFWITSTPSPSPDCSKLCRAIIYSCPVRYWKL